MIGKNAGLVTTQGERLAELFAADGYPVIAVSTARNRYVRLADITSTLVRRRHDYDVMVLQVFSGPSFVVEDIASWLGKRFGKRIIMVMRGGAMPEFIARFPGWVERVLGEFEGRVLAFTGSTGVLCAGLHVSNPRSFRDSMIAATAIEHSFSVVTRNVRDFEGTGVAIIDPWQA